MLIVKGHRWFTALADRAQMRAFEGVTISHAPGPGLVGVVFHAYSGVFAFTRQVEYRFWADPSDARLVLARLHRFNLTWGFFAYGALIIPILSLGNYWVQQARIKEQAAQTTVGQVRSNLMLKGWRYE
ncbi:MAG: hypothetical protein ABFC96_09835 [Thermoguttaceae bacterium]